VSDQGTSRAPSARELWGAARLPALIVGAVLAVTVLSALVAGRSHAGFLDPRAVDPEGSRALANLLRGQGVQVDLLRTIGDVGARARSGVTVLVTLPGVLRQQQLATLAQTGADLVLVAPGQSDLDALAAGLSASGAADVAARSPACSLEAAVRAGMADMGGLLYSTASDNSEVPPVSPVSGILCYPAEDGASLAQVRVDDHTVTAIGDPAPLTNDRLDEQGNAALSMILLGAHDQLLWYLPSSDDPALGPRSVGDLAPDGVRFGLLQLAAGVALLAIWRARRLGPVVPEPLPVVVRAAETVEGRARLYRRFRARDRAAAALREAALSRIMPILGLPRRVEPTAVVSAIAARSGWPPPDVGALLYGRLPDDDATLVHLANELDRLEREVRRT
jgi:hypothetical protein